MALRDRHAEARESEIIISGKKGEDEPLRLQHEKE